MKAIDKLELILLKRIDFYIGDPDHEEVIKAKKLLNLIEQRKKFNS